MKILLRLIWAPALLTLVFLLPASGAHAGTYMIKSCWDAPSPYWKPVLAEYSANNPSRFRFDSSYCGPTESEQYRGLQIDSMATANQGDIARIKFTAPSGVGITGVTAYTNSDVHSPSGPVDGWMNNYVFHNYGSNGVVMPPPRFDMQAIDFDLPTGQMRSSFEMNLKCVDLRCPGGGYMPYSHIGNIDLRLKDSTKPVAVPGAPGAGDLFANGIVSGVRTAVIDGYDGGGSGVRSVWMGVNGQFLLWADAPDQSSPGVSCNPATPTYNSFEPCPTHFSKQWSVNTAQAPFKNGANSVLVCGRDYSGNGMCLSPITVYVQN